MVTLAARPQYDRAAGVFAVFVSAVAGASWAEPTLGHLYFSISLFLLLAFLRGICGALPCFAVTLALTSMLPIITSYVEGSFFELPFKSGVWLLSGLLPASVLAAEVYSCITAVAVLGSIIPAFILMDLAVAGGWVGVAELTNPTFRILAPSSTAAISCLLTSSLSRPVQTRQVQLACITFVAAIVGVALSLAVPTSPVRGVVFDESHGHWETIHSSFQPDDFGRGVSYTYSLLRDYAQVLTGSAASFDKEESSLPALDKVFVLKMPTVPLSPRFCQSLAKWVDEGGRLIVVADHTDLYDHAQNLNALLSERWGFSIRTDATFDRSGMPNAPSYSRVLRITARIDATGYETPWLTGATVSRIPIGSIVLSSFGPSFAEPGDYGHPNRFGSFVPRTSLAYAPQASAFAFAAGLGGVAVILDSTPWSNFSLFREEYQKLFRGLLGALELPSALFLLGILIPALVPIAFVTAFWRTQLAFTILAFLLGLVGGLGWRVSADGVASSIENRDFRLRVVVGNEARLEFLALLVAPWERNYSRIISSLSKYGLKPVATVGRIPTPLSAARRWLLIEPNLDELPAAESVFAHLRRGSDLTVIFAPHMAGDRRVREWITSLDLNLNLSSALALTEDSGRPIPGNFSTRRGAALMRDTRSITVPRADGLMKDFAFDRLWQTYTIRPTTLPRTSGLFTVGFSADQISDSAIGDVWDGVRPSALAALRERQMGLLLSGNEAPLPWAENIVLSPPPPAVESRLRGFLVVEDGRIILDGVLEDKELEEHESAPVAYSESPRRWLADLRARTLAHVQNHCPAKEPSGQSAASECKKRLLSNDGIEWLVSRKYRADGLVALELLHERRWSGLGANINIVFAD